MMSRNEHFVNLIISLKSRLSPFRTLACFIAARTCLWSDEARVRRIKSMWRDNGRSLAMHLCTCQYEQWRPSASVASAVRNIPGEP